MKEHKQPEKVNRVWGTRDTFTVIAITIMWLLTIPALFALFTRGLGWPSSFFLLVFLPILGFFVPGGYILAIISNRRYNRDGKLSISPRLLGYSSLLGVLIGVVSLLTVFTYGFYQGGPRPLSVLTAVVALALCVGVIRVFQKTARELNSSTD